MLCLCVFENLKALINEMIHSLVKEKTGLLERDEDEMGIENMVMVVCKFVYFEYLETRL